MLARAVAAVGGALGHVAALLLAINPLLVPLAAHAQQKITVDPTAPRALQPGVGTSGGGKPVIDITAPNAGISQNRLHDLITPNGLIFNNSRTSGTSQTGGAVKANPNLLSGGPANVILSTVSGGATQLGGATEVFGTRADLIVANENGVQCVGCAFVNVGRATLTTGVPTVSGSQISLNVRKGMVGVWGAGLSGAAEVELIGREVVIDGPVSATGQITASGGTQAYDYNQRTAKTAPILSERRTPYAVDASALGAMKADQIRIIGNESGMGVRLDSSLQAKGAVDIRSLGDANVKSVSAGGKVAIQGTGAVKQTEGTIAAGAAGIDIAGRSFESSPGSKLSTPGAINVTVSDFVNISGEVDSQSLTLTADKSIFNYGRVVAATKLSIVAGESAANTSDAGAARSYTDAWVSSNIPWMKWYVATYPSDWYSSYFRSLVTRADLTAATTVSGSASLSGANVALTASRGSFSNTGAVAAVQDLTVTAALDITNGAIAAPAANLSAGRNAALVAGRDIVNIGGTISAGGALSASAGRNILGQTVVTSRTWTDTGTATTSNTPVNSIYSYTYLVTPSVSHQRYDVLEALFSSDGSDAYLRSGGNITLDGARVSAAGTATLDSGTGIASRGADYTDSDTSLTTTQTWIKYSWGTSLYLGATSSSSPLLSTVKSVFGSVGGANVALLARNSALDLTSTVVNSRGDLYASAYGQLYNAQALRVPGNLTLVSTAGNVDNRGGLTAGKALTLDAYSSLYNQGALRSGTSLALNSRAYTVDNRGKLTSGTTTTLSAAQWISNSGAINAGTSAQLYAVASSVSNSGAINAKTWAQLYSANSAVDSYAAVTAGDWIQLYAGYWINNRGSLTSGTSTQLYSATSYVSNSGAINTGTSAQLYAIANSVSNSGAINAKSWAQLYSANYVVDNYAAINAGDWIQLYAGYWLNNRGPLTSGTSTQLYSDTSSVTNSGVITAKTWAQLYSAKSAVDSYAAVTAGDWIQLYAGYWLNNRGALTSGTSTHLYADTSSVTNSGVITAKTWAQLFSAKSAVDSYSAIKAGSSIQLYAGYWLNNRGALNSGTSTQLYADTSSVTNSGIINAKTSAQLYSAKSAVDSYAAVTAGDWIQLYAGYWLNNRGALTSGTSTELHAGTSSVTSSGAIATGTDLAIDGAQLSLTGAMSPSRNLSVTARASGLTFSGTLVANGALSLSAQGDIDTTSLMADSISVTSAAGSIRNRSTMQASAGELYLSAANGINNYSDGYATQTLLYGRDAVTLIAGKDIVNAVAEIRSQGDVMLQSNTGAIRNTGDVLSSSATIHGTTSSTQEWWVTLATQTERPVSIAGNNVWLVAGTDIELKGASLTATNQLSLSASGSILGATPIAYATTETRLDRTTTVTTPYAFLPTYKVTTNSDTTTSRTVSSGQLDNDLTAASILLSGTKSINLFGIGAIQSTGTLQATSGTSVKLAGGNVRASTFAFGNTPSVILDTTLSSTGTVTQLDVAQSVTNLGRITGRDVVINHLSGTFDNQGQITASRDFTFVSSAGQPAGTTFASLLSSSLSSLISPSVGNVGRVVAGSDIYIQSYRSVATGLLEAPNVQVVTAAGDIAVRGAILADTVALSAARNLEVRGILADDISLVARGGSFTASGFTAADGSDFTTGRSLFASALVGAVGSEWINTQDVMSRTGAVVYARNSLAVSSAGDLNVTNGATLASQSDLALTTPGSINITSLVDGLTFTRSAIIAAGDLRLSAGVDVRNTGGTLSAKGNLIIGAGRDIINEAVKTNFVLTSEHGCDGTCGGWGFDFTPAEMLAGSGLILSATRSIVNNAGNIGAAGSIMLNAGTDITNQAMSGKFANVNYYRAWDTCNGRFLGVCYSWTHNVDQRYGELPVIRQGAIQTEFGDIILNAGNDIRNTGGLISAGGMVNLEAGRDVVMDAVSQELKYVSYQAKTSSFVFIPYKGGWANTDYNSYATVLSAIEGNDIAINAKSNINALGASALALNDLTLTAGGSVTFDAKQNWLYKNESGGSWGFFVRGFNLINSIAQGDFSAALKDYINANPTLAAVHMLATAKDGWGTLNGSLALLWGGAATLNAANDEFKKLGGQIDLGRSLANQFLPEDWKNLSGLANGDWSGCMASATTGKGSCSLTIGIGFRYDVWKSKQEWTESHVSVLGAGQDLLISADKDIALVGGSNLTAGRDLTLVAGQDLIVAAVADNIRSSSSSWGASISLGFNGVTIGGHVAGSESSSTIYRNAAMTAGEKIFILTGRDASFLGAQVQGKNISMTIGRDLIIASKQNASSSSSWGMNASVTITYQGGLGGFSVGGNYANASRLYTDTPTSITATDVMDIYVGRTTMLMGAVINSKGSLKLDTGNFVFSNFNDKDRSYSFNASVSYQPASTATLSWNGAVGGSYKNTTGITYATVAAAGHGEISVRNKPDIDLSGLNRDINNVQRVTSSTYFALQIPGLNLAKLANDLQGAANFINAASADFAALRGRGDQAVLLAQRMLANGLSRDQVQAIIGTHEFEVAVARAEYVEQLRNNPRGVTTGDLQVLALGELALYAQVDADLAARLKIECGLFATNCEIIVGELKKRMGAQGLNDILNNAKTTLINLSETSIGKEQQEQQLVRALLACSITEPEVFRQFMVGLNDRESSYLKGLAKTYLAGNESIFDAALAKVNETQRPNMTEAEKAAAREQRNAWLAANFENQLQLGRLGFDLVGSAAIIKATSDIEGIASTINDPAKREAFVKSAQEAVGKAWQQLKDAPLDTIKTVGGTVFDALKEDLKEAFNKLGASLYENILGKYAFEQGLANAELLTVIAALINPIKKLKYMDNLIPDVCSFAPETQVLMADGTHKEIARLRVGELVASRNEFTGSQGVNRITALLDRLHNDRVVVSVASAKGEVDEIVTTLEHPFYVEGQGFLQAADLKAGMAIARWQPTPPPVQLVGIRNADTTGHLLVRAVTIEEAGVDTWRAYNLTVANDHSYFVGGLNAWVHNDCWKIAKHGDMPKPRGGAESHHGVMSAWMERNFPNYDADLAPAILMPAENHNATRGVYNTWRAEKAREMGGTFSWSNVTEPDMRLLSDRMFDAANVPSSIRQQYWIEYDRMRDALRK